jgi:HEAT repeat protein
MGLLKANRTVQEEPTQAASALPLPELDDADPMQRRRAVRMRANEPDAVAALVGLLAKEEDNLVRQTAFLELAALNSDEAAMGVSELLSAADPALRNGALEALSTMPEHAVRLLEPLGQSPDPDVRIFAVLLANELHVESTTDWLMALAGREDDANVCSNLAEALGGTGREDVLPILQSIIDKFPQEPFLAFAAETAMQRIREG